MLQLNAIKHIINDCKKLNKFRIKYRINPKIPTKELLSDSEQNIFQMINFLHHAMGPIKRKNNGLNLYQIDAASDEAKR